MTKPIEQLIRRFIAEHRLPGSFRSTIDDYYQHVLPWLKERRREGETMLLGINGAQGTGKSTLAGFIAEHARVAEGWSIAVLSIDDFYLTRAEREQLAADVHPLLKTRGVPGTHDVAMLSRCLDDLRMLGDGETVSLPRFDKAVDDRAAEESWPSVTGPIDLIILEGWCVGSEAQSDGDLQGPINDLERIDDVDGSWRRYSNEQLSTSYACVFAQLDALIFLGAPGFDAILKWRLEQEEKLAARTSGDRSGIMDREQIERFIQHYERITRANLETLPSRADLVFELAPDHSVSGITGRDPGAGRP